VCITGGILICAIVSSAGAGNVNPQEVLEILRAKQAQRAQTMDISFHVSRDRAASTLSREEFDKVVRWRRQQLEQRLSSAPSAMLESLHDRLARVREEVEGDLGPSTARWDTHFVSDSGRWRAETRRLDPFSVGPGGRYDPRQDVTTLHDGETTWQILSKTPEMLRELNRESPHLAEIYPGEKHTSSDSLFHRWREGYLTEDLLSVFTPVSLERIAGEEHNIKLVLEHGSKTLTIIVDETRDFEPIRISADSGGMPEWEWEALEWREAGGEWWPARAVLRSRELPDLAGEALAADIGVEIPARSVALTFELTSLAVGQTLSEEQFVPVLPENTFVTDWRFEGPLTFTTQRRLKGEGEINAAGALAMTRQRGEESDSEGGVEGIASLDELLENAPSEQPSASAENAPAGVAGGGVASGETDAIPAETEGLPTVGIGAVAAGLVLVFLGILVLLKKRAVGRTRP